MGGKKLYIKDWKGSQQESVGLTGKGLLRVLDGGWGPRELWGLMCWHERLGGTIVLLANVSLDKEYS